MPISSHEDWVQIAELNDQDQIRFTPEFRALMSDLEWEAKAFVGHLLGLGGPSVPAPAGLHQRRGDPALRTSLASSTATDWTSRKTWSSTGRWIGASTETATSRLAEPAPDWA